MRTIKEYNDNELRSLIKAHNSLVKDHYKVAKGDINTMFTLISGANNDNDLMLPFFEIASNETLAGHAQVFDLEWAEQKEQKRRLFDLREGMRIVAKRKRVIATIVKIRGQEAEILDEGDDVPWFMNIETVPIFFDEIRQRE